MAGPQTGDNNALGQRLLTLTERMVSKVNTIDMGIVDAVSLDIMRVDITLKHKVNGKIIKILGCPIFGLGSSTSAMVSVPRPGDVMIVMFAKHELDEMLKRRDPQTIDELTLFDLNNAFVIGGIQSISDAPYDDIWSVARNKDCKFVNTLLSELVGEERTNLIYASNFYDTSLPSIKNPLRKNDACQSFTDLNLPEGAAPIVIGDVYNTLTGVSIAEESIRYKIINWSFPDDEFSYLNDQVVKKTEQITPIIANHTKCADIPQRPCLSPIYYTTQEVIITKNGIEIYTRTPCERVLIEHDTDFEPVYPIERCDIITPTGSTTVVTKKICKLNGSSLTCDKCYELYQCSPPDLTDVPLFQMYVKEVPDIPLLTWEQRDELTRIQTKRQNEEELTDAEQVYEETIASMFDDPTIYTPRPPVTITPEFSPAGSECQITITGATFESESTVDISGVGITVSYLSRTVSSLVCKLVITGTAPESVREVRVTNPKTKIVHTGSFTVGEKPGDPIQQIEDDIKMGMDWTSDPLGGAYEVYIQSLIPYHEPDLSVKSMRYWSRRSELIASPVRARYKADRRNAMTGTDGQPDITTFSNVIDVYINGAQETTVAPEVGVLLRRPDIYTKRYNAVYESKISSISALASILTIHTVGADGTQVMTSASGNETTGFSTSVDRLVEIVSDPKDLTSITDRKPFHLAHLTMQQKDEKGIIDMYAKDTLQLTCDGDTYIKTAGDMILDGKNVYLNGQVKIADNQGSMSQCCANTRKCLYNPRSIIGERYPAPAASSVQQFKAGDQVYMSESLRNYLGMGNGKYEPVNLKDVIDAYNSKNGTQYDVTENGITDESGMNLNECFNSLLYTSVESMPPSEQASIDSDSQTYSLTEHMVKKTATASEYSEYAESAYDTFITPYEAKATALHQKIDAYCTTLDEQATSGDIDWVTAGQKKNNIQAGYTALFGTAEANYTEYLTLADPAFTINEWITDDGVMYLSDAYKSTYITQAVADLRSQTGEIYETALSTYLDLASEFGS